MNDLVNFTLGSANLAVFVEDGKPYFSLLEIAKNLGYSRPDIALRDFYSRQWDSITKMSKLLKMPKTAAEQVIRSPK